MERAIKRALISVFDKTGLDALLPLLHEAGIELVASGGTYDHIAAQGLPAVRVEDLTLFPHMLGGRVKTLHPHIFGAILARRSHAGDEADIAQFALRTIDLVVVDLYPFEQTLASGAEEAELIEKIDIGGVSLIRAAAKNFQDVLIVSSLSQYAELKTIMRAGAKTTLAQRRTFAAQAFMATARYDAAISGYFASTLGEAQSELSLQASLPSEPTQTPLRYGENPHQQAFFLGDLQKMFQQLHGKELSYNNLLDLHAGVALVDEFPETTVAILKHGTPCGVAIAKNLEQAWDRALSTDPQSAFGGAIVVNRPVDGTAAQKMNGIFFEVCLAPSYDPDALEILSQKKNRILLARGTAQLREVAVRSVLNGVLVQANDSYTHNPANWETVTKRHPTPKQTADMLLANRVVKHCKSNAIAIALDGRIVGVGAGETSRVDALQHAIDRALRFGHSLQGAALASDAFFPFADCVQLAAEHGITSIVQPGGSVRDAESIAACEKQDIAMVFTRHRHFKH